MGQEDYLDQLLNSLNKESKNDKEINPSEEIFISSDSQNMQDFFNDSDESKDEEIDISTMLEETGNDDGFDIASMLEETSEDEELDISSILEETGNADGFDIASMLEETSEDEELDISTMLNETSEDMDKENDINTMLDELNAEMSGADEIVEQLETMGKENFDSLIEDTVDTFNFEDLINLDELSESFEDETIYNAENPIEEEINVEDLLENVDFASENEEIADVLLEDIENLGLEELTDEQNAILEDLDSILEEADRVEVDNFSSELLAEENSADELLESLNNLEFSDASNEQDSVGDLLGGLDLGFEANEADLFSDDDLMKLFDEDVDGVKNDEPMMMTEEEAARVIEDITGTTTEENDGEKVKKEKKKGLFANLFAKKESTDSEGKSEDSAEKIEIEEKPKKEKKKKEKKPKKEKVKKEKKPKKEKEVLPPEPWIGVSKGNVISIVILVISLVALLMICVEFIPYKISIANAHNYYEHQKYDKSYEAMVGLEIKENDLEFFCKVQNIMWLESKYNEYQTYVILNNDYEALSALIKAVEKYDLHIEEANLSGAAPVYSEIYANVEKALEEEFGVSIEDARAIYVLESSQEFSRALYDILGYPKLVIEE